MNYLTVYNAMRKRAADLGENSIPRDHYLGRQLEETTRGQMGLDPESGKYSREVMEALERTPGRADRKQMLANLLNLNTPGAHQLYMKPKNWSPGVIFEKGYGRKAFGEAPFDPFDYTGTRLSSFGIRPPSYRATPVTPPYQEQVLTSMRTAAKPTRNPGNTVLQKLTGK